MISLKASEAASLFELTVVSGNEGINNIITNVYIGDLLSRVMDKAAEHCAWITIHGQINIVAVAALVGMSCIIVCEDSVVSHDTLKRADIEGIPIFTTPLSEFEIAKKFVLYELEN